VYKPPYLTRFGIVTGSLMIGCLLLCGCEKTEPVSSYTVLKHESLQTTEFLSEYQKSHPKPERMIGLVLPRGSTLWFFKLQGNLEAVSARENTVRDFIKSLTFTTDDKPEWQLPPQWQQLPGGNELRYATLVLDTESKLELTVTKFPARTDIPVTEQVVMNINRWRGQLSLPPIDDADLDDQSEKLLIADGTGYWISIIGRPQVKPSGMAPPPPQARSDVKADRGTESSSPTYAKPAEWTEGPQTQFAVVSLLIVDGDQKATVTVTRSGGTQVLNVNRWRGQLGLAPISQEELSPTSKVQIGTLGGELFDLKGEGRSIVGVIVEDQPQSWFIKLAGDAPLVERERGRFDDFLKSLQLKN
jgi:hypothetical protein